MLHANFWAEDEVWYSDAYNDGWHSLLQPHAGYLQLIPRLVALFAQHAPLRWAPTVFNAFALIFQVLPPALLLTRRFGIATFPADARRLLALLYVTMPNTGEVLINLTNSQWHLAVTAFLLMFSKPSVSKGGHIVELIAVFVVGLTGPFCIPLAIVALIGRLSPICKVADSLNVLSCVPIIVSAGMQISLLILGTSNRSSAPLGVDAVTLLRILAWQVFVGAIVGTNILYHLSLYRSWAALLSVPVVVGSAYLLSRVIGQQVSLFAYALLFGGLMLSASLAEPQVSLSSSQWDILAQPGSGTRYFFIPMFVWLSGLVILLGDKSRLYRQLAATLVVASLFGAIADAARDARPAKTNFDAEAALFEVSPVGTVMKFDVLPSSFPPMSLRKRQRL